MRAVRPVLVVQIKTVGLEPRKGVGRVAVHGHRKCCGCRLRFKREPGKARKMREKRVRRIGNPFGRKCRALFVVREETPAVGDFRVKAG